MIISYAIIEGTKVIGFFEDESEGPVSSEVPFRAVDTLVSDYPTADSPTKELHIDDAGTLYWIETATLSEVKARQVAKITQSKVSANMSFFVFNGKQIQADEASFREIQSTNGYVALNNELPPDWPGGWKAIDNSYVVIGTVATWRDFYNTMVTTGTANFKKSQGLKLAIANAATIEEVQAIEWTTTT